MVEKLNRSSCLVKFCWIGIKHKQRIQIVEVVAGSLGGLAFAGRLVWLVDLGQMREHCCTPGAAATMDELCSS